MAKKIAVIDDLSAYGQEVAAELKKSAIKASILTPRVFGPIADISLTQPKYL